MKVEHCTAEHDWQSQWTAGADILKYATCPVWMYECYWTPTGVFSLRVTSTAQTLRIKELEREDAILTQTGRRSAIVRFATNRKVRKTGVKRESHQHSRVGFALSYQNMTRSRTDVIMPTTSVGLKHRNFVDLFPVTGSPCRQHLEADGSLSFLTSSALRSFHLHTLVAPGTCFLHHSLLLH